MLLLFLVACGGTAESVIRIQDASGLISLSKSVNEGTSYMGTTVLLDSDLDLSGRAFEPIGNDSANCFLGTFDGQGHAISNLAMNVTSQHAGLFGYSSGLAIRNVILAKSCTVMSLHDAVFDDSYVGGVIARCSATDKACSVESIVSMASVTFSGDDNDNDLYIGGVAGCLEADAHEASLKNCANYGPVTHAGNSKNSFIGGIVGNSYSWTATKKAYIRNVLNYGAVAHQGTSLWYLFIGGIVGYGESSVIDNSVSAGVIAPGESYSPPYMGSVAGYLGYSMLSHCYWSADISDHGCGISEGTKASMSAQFDNNLEFGEAVSAGGYTGTSLVNALNAVADSYALRDYSRWVLNKNEKAVSFRVNGIKLSFTLDSKVVLLPSLANEATMLFDGWYTDDKYAEPLKEFAIDESVELHSKWGEKDMEVTITFDARGGTPTPEPITSRYLSVVSLPRNSSKSGCSIGYWENEYGESVGWDFTAPSRNATLFAVWLCTRIGTVEDFVDFSKVVNSGEADYEGTTVFVDSDLDFSGRVLEPVGRDGINYFSGAFDGQGHTISGLTVASSSSEDMGLFGSSDGLTVRNVVLDSSCAVVSSYESDYYTTVGGLVGYCVGSNGPCRIENTVSIASVTFNGTSTGDSYLLMGGIAGCLIASGERDSFVKNCANYGPVTHVGKGVDLSCIGGVVGYSDGFTLTKAYTQNSLSCGAITRKGEAESISFIGGISGYSSDSNEIENSVSSSEISSDGEYDFIGGVAGYIYSSNLTNCFWTSSEVSAPCGYGNMTGDERVSYAPINSDVVEKLNAYSAGRDSWARWLLNADGSLVKFKINFGKEFAVKTPIVLLFDLVDNTERSFSGWYNNMMLTSPFTGSDVVRNPTLYGMFCGKEYTVTFDIGNGTTVAKTLTCNETIPYPVTSRDGYTFVGWFMDSALTTPFEGRRISKNVTLYAKYNDNSISFAARMTAPLWALVLSLLFHLL